MTAITLVLGAVALFLGFWAGVVSLIGFGGWRSMAQRYPAHEWPERGEGMRIGWQSGRVGMSSYNNALNAVVTADGLYLRPLRLFAYNHPPVFIPWEAIQGMDQAMFGIKVGLEGGNGLRLSGRLGRTVRDAYLVWDSAHAGPTDEPELDADVEPTEAAADPLPTWRRSRTR